jgi:hypothetical protein
MQRSGRGRKRWPFAQNLPCRGPGCPTCPNDLGRTVGRVIPKASISHGSPGVCRRTSCDHITMHASLNPPRHAGILLFSGSLASSLLRGKRFRRPSSCRGAARQIHRSLTNGDNRPIVCPTPLLRLARWYRKRPKMELRTEPCQEYQGHGTKLTGKCRPAALTCWKVYRNDNGVTSADDQANAETIPRLRQPQAVIPKQ